MPRKQSKSKTRKNVVTKTRSITASLTAQVAESRIGKAVPMVKSKLKLPSKLSFLTNNRFAFWLKKRSRKFKIALLGVLIALLSCTFLLWGMPLPSALNSDSLAVSTKILDRKGETIYEIYSQQRRTPVKLSDLPDYIAKATIATEDKDFYNHKGFDISGIVRALRNNIFKGGLQGGSTLTQQLVKNALLTSDRTIKRKAQEAVLTLATEFTYSKNTILEMYLNQIPYGGASYGIEAASELYFNKKAKDLSLAQAALLVGLPASPTRYSPFGANPDLAIERQKYVLQRMVEEKYISQEDADKASKEKIVYADITPLKAPHFALWVKEQLVDKYGQRLVEQGGLRVTTTLDLDVQEKAEKIVFDEIEKLKKQKVSNGAALVVRPASGEILAMVGSKGYFAKDIDGKVNIIFSKRQPGSSIKPLNYALGLQDGKITPSTAIADVPTCFLVTGQDTYCPVNYDGTFHGATQIRFALGNSYNIPAVRVLALNGLENFVDFARNLGISTFTDPSKYGLSLTLGGGEVMPADMAIAYGVFANGGIKQKLTSILKVEDWQGKVYEESKPHDLDGTRVLSNEVSFLISHMLLDNNARSAAFGTSSYLVVSNHPEVSVKTGTTNDRRDNWTVGYSAQAVTVVWVGNNDNSVMSGAVSGVSGASPIWNRIMKTVLDKSEKGFYNKTDDGHAWPRQPDGVVGNLVCWTTGLLAPGPKDNPGCPARFEYFLKDFVPSVDSGLRQDIQIDKVTHEISKPDASPDSFDIQNHPIIKDPLGTIFCLDCTPPSTAVNIKYPLPESLIRKSPEPL